MAERQWYSKPTATMLHGTIEHYYCDENGNVVADAVEYRDFVLANSRLEKARQFTGDNALELAKQYIEKKWREKDEREMPLSGVDSAVAAKELEEALVEAGLMPERCVYWELKGEVSKCWEITYTVLADGGQLKTFARVLGTVALQAGPEREASLRGSW